MTDNGKSLIIDEDKLKKERSTIVKYLERLSRKEIEPIEVITSLEHLLVILDTNGLSWSEVIQVLRDKLNPGIFEKGDL